MTPSIRVQAVTEALEAANFLTVEKETAAIAISQYISNGFIYDTDRDELLRQVKRSRPDWEFDDYSTFMYLYNKYCESIYDMAISNH